ncbi:MAG TPA: YicC/YloC family endoribonuclease [Bauldia sp.]|nr:YicC/YloC family endoribonuclease [Bauldia sp.]
MTGFARTAGVDAGRSWVWELRSVNGKGLDIRLRLPPRLERLEAAARERVARRITRGNVQATLSFASGAEGETFRINEAVLADVLAAIERLAPRVNAQPPTLDGILSIKGVVEFAEAIPETDPTFDARLLASLDDALASLVAIRSQEGAAIAAVLGLRLDEIARLAGTAEASPARTPQAIRNRLAEQVAMLLDAAPALDPDRLFQEAVLLATKADIREELDRLSAHVEAARLLIAEGGAVGRRLDFLAQEFNREVNTLCAKANDRELTAIGLDLKAVVDQFREQVQNLE